jgi:hypothetical protein
MHLQDQGVTSALTLWRLCRFCHRHLPQARRNGPHGHRPPKTSPCANPMRSTQVASAADTHAGGGAVSVVVADKNLVPSPPGNLGRVAGILKGTGGRKGGHGWGWRREGREEGGKVKEGGEEGEEGTAFGRRMAFDLVSVRNMGTGTAGITHKDLPSLVTGMLDERHLTCRSGPYRGVRCQCQQARRKRATLAPSTAKPPSCPAPAGDAGAATLAVVPVADGPSLPLPPWLSAGLTGLAVTRPCQPRGADAPKPNH